MGGYRARGALATLALATVVLVAVVVAGTVSMPPLGNNWTADITRPEDRDSFEVVGGVIVPKSSEPAARPQVVDPDKRDGDVEVAGDLEPTEPPETTPEVVPPGPILGPVDPQPPVVVPTEPPVVDPTQPPVVEPTDEPVVVPTQPRPPDFRPDVGAPKKVVARPDGHLVFKPKPAKPAKPAKNGTPSVRPGKRGNKPPIVIVHGPRGPKWRPSQPARQRHPNDADKWSRAEPHPKQHAAPARKPRGPREHPTVGKAPAKPRAVVPSSPKVHKDGGGPHRGSLAPRPSQGKNGRHGQGPSPGHRGKGKGKGGRR